MPIKPYFMKKYTELFNKVISARLYRDYHIGKQLPWKLLVEITRTCNHRCLNCSIWQSPKKATLPLKGYEELFKDNPNLIWLSLTGGEPFLRPDIVEIVKLAKKYTPVKFLSIPTDGYRPELIIEKSKAIENLGIELHLTISLDGPKEVHDKIRGKPGAYDNAVKTFNELKKQGIDVRYQSTLHSHNLDCFKDFYLKNKQDIGVLTFTQTSDIYYDNNQKVTPLTGEAAARMFEFIDKHYKLQKKQDVFEKMHIKIAQAYLRNPDMMLPCTAGYSGAFISSSGDVHPCFFMPPWGNLKKNSFREIWFSELADKARQKIKSKQCPKCWVNCFSFNDMLTYPEKAFSRAYLKLPPK